MAKYTSGRQRKLKIGINSYSEDLTSLEVIGKVGIGTTNPRTKLEVNGVLGFSDRNVRIGDSTTGLNGTSFNNNFIGVGAGKNDLNYQGIIGILDGIDLTITSSTTILSEANNGYGPLSGTGGDGTGGQFYVYRDVTGAVNYFYGNSGQGYQVGDVITIDGALVGGVSVTDDVTATVTYTYNTTGDNNNFLGYKTGYNNTSGQNNNFLGYLAGESNTTGYSNNFFGSNAGYTNTTGGGNNFLGYSAGRYNTTGSGNNFFGDSAGEHSGGNNNNFLGSNAGAGVGGIIPYGGVGITSSITIPSQANGRYYPVYGTGGNGTGAKFEVIRNQYGAVDGFYSGVGVYGGYNYQVGDIITIDGADVGGVSGTDDIIVTVTITENNTSGSDNNFFGNQAGSTNITGRDNNFLGRSVGYNNTTGAYNNFFGYYAGYNNTDGSSNNFLGRSAGYLNTTGCSNNFFGYIAGYQNTTGGNNNFLGAYAGQYNTTGNKNTFLGSWSGTSTTASNKVIIGSGYYPGGYNRYFFDSPDTTKDTQFAVGIRTDANPANYWLVGDENFNIGIGTTNPRTKLEVNGVLGFSDTNVRIGDSTTGANLTPGNPYPIAGTNNNFIGVGAGQSTTTGFYNNFLGYQAGLNNTTGDDNNFLGSYAGYRNTTGNQNNFLGYFAGYYNTTGGVNNAIGKYAGIYNTTGYYNNFFGAQAGYYNTSGAYNNFLGSYAGKPNTTGYFNTFLGSYVGISTSASYKVVIGAGNYYQDPFDSPDTTKDTQFAVGIKTDVGDSKYWLVGDENFNIGIGTTNPRTKLEVNGVLGFSDRNVRIGDSTTGVNQFGVNNTFIGVGAGKGHIGILDGNPFTITSSTTILSAASGAWSPLSGTGGSGTGGQFEVARDGTGAVAYFSGYNGQNYLVGDIITIDGADVGGVSGTDDVTAIITSTYNSTGNYNNFLGYHAGYNNTSGDYNNFLGYQAGINNTTGSENTFLGRGAGKYNTYGNYNNFFGSYAGYNNTTGYYNSFFGSGTGSKNTTGTYNNFFGNYAGFCNISGNKNTFIGYYSGISTSASNKIILGNGYNFSNPFDSPDTTKDTQFAVGIRTDDNPANYWLVGDENFNIGIGTTNPRTKLEIGGVLGFSDTNVRIGDNTTGANLTPGNPYPINNNFIGVGAGQSTTTGAYNNFLGYLAGNKNTTGNYNNFIGQGAGQNNTTGYYNNFFGANAGRYNTTGYYNNFFGYYAGRNNTTGSDNNFIGSFVGYYNTTGNYNNFLGFDVGYHNTTGYDNNFLGERAGFFNTTGHHNTFLGSWSGISTSASNKIIFGNGYNYLNFFDSPDTTKDNQFAVGIRTDANPSKYWLVGDENFNIGIGTTNPRTKLEIGGVLGFSDRNVRIGDSTTGLNNSGTNNNFIGVGAGKGLNGGINGSLNIISSTTIPSEAYNDYQPLSATGGSGTGALFYAYRDGTGALLDIQAPIFNGQNYLVGDVLTFDGADVGGVSGTDDVTVIITSTYNSTGNNNNFLGQNAGYNNTYGYSNNFFGRNAGYNNTNGSNNNFFGDSAGYNNKQYGQYNNFLGAYAGYSNIDGTYNNFLGFNAGRCNITGFGNNFLGRGAGYYNTTGNYNNAFGYYAGKFNTTGQYNNFFGSGAAGNNTTGSYNNFIGNYAGFCNISGNKNTFIGYYSGISTSASNKIIFGNGYNYLNSFDSPDTTKDTQFAVGLRTDANPSKYWLVGNENFNIGIGTTNPTEKLTVVGDASITGLVSVGNTIRSSGNLNLQSANKIWGFSTDGALTLPQGSIISETSTTTVIAPPTAQPGQSLVIRPTSAGWTVTSSGYIVYGQPITVSVNLLNWSYYGTVNYEITGTGVNSTTLGRATTGKVVFTGIAEPDTQTVTWTIPANSNITEFTFTLTSVDGTYESGPPGPNPDPALYYNFESNALPTGNYVTVTNNGITNSEVSHIHLVAGDPTTTDIYLGDDDQYVKIERNAGNVVVGTSTNTNQWIFGTDGSLTLPGDILINDTTIQGSFTSITETTSAVGIHSTLSTSIYRSVEYTIQVTEGSNFHATKILTIHDGSIAYNSEYGTIYNNASVSGFNVDVSGGNIRLLAIPASASTTNYTINFIATKI